MIFKDHHSKPKYTLPKYPRSQNLTPLSPLTIKQFYWPFFTAISTQVVNFSDQKQKSIILFHVNQCTVRGIFLNRSPQKKRAIQRFRGVKCYFSKKASFLEVSHLMSFHFIQIPSNRSLVYDILCHRTRTYWKQLN